MKRRIILLSILFGVVSLIAIVYIIFSTGKDFQVPNYSEPTKYSNLFSDTCLHNLNIEFSQSNAYRDTVSFFSFRKDYEIVICKLNDSTPLPIDNYISHENISSYWQQSLNVYTVFHLGEFKFEYLMKEPYSHKGITFRYCCDSLKYCIEQDDILYFNGIFSSASIIKGESVNADLLFITSGLSYPLSVLFTRKNGSIFFIAMTPMNNTIKMDPKLLWQCVKK